MGLFNREKENKIPSYHMQEIWENEVRHQMVNKSIPTSQKKQKKFLLMKRELTIYQEYTIKPSKTEFYRGPKGITDIIGGYYGNTAIRTEEKVKHTPAVKKWKQDKIVLSDDKFTITNSKNVIFYNQIDSIRIDKKFIENIPAHMGFLVTLKLNQAPHYISFRTLLADGFNALMKQHISKNSKKKSTTSRNSKTSKKEKSSNENSKKHTSKDTKKNPSDADELMKYAELYEKGLLTEEEFTALKKKLIGL